VSEAQKRVLVALCRPLGAGGRGAAATNEEIARELVLSVSAVKGHLRVLFARFGLDSAAQNQKRSLLAERALASGVVSARDLE
jgi:DNA-binding CsgD family transcriptional regulator